MKIVYQLKNNYVLRFNKGERYLDEFKKFLEEEKITSAFFYGLGGFLEVEIAFYDLDKKKYISKKMDGPFEVASLIGNVAENKNGIVIHNHVVLGDSNYRAFAGHLVDAVVGGTLEIYVTKLNEGGKLKRELDKGTGLNLLL